MSGFFGFDPSLPREKAHNASAHGFGQVPDVFAGLSSRDYREDEEEEGLNFEDTYDGLGDQLDDTDDAFNANTFGAGPVSRDFDFSGQTAHLSSKPAIAPQQKQYAPQPQQLRQQPYQQQRPPVEQYRQTQQPPQTFSQQPAPKPARSGYERYKEPDSIHKLEASASIWGHQPQRSASSYQQPQRESTPQQAPVASISNVTRKMMSLDEVEAMMRAQSLAQQPSPAPVPQAEEPPPVPMHLRPDTTASQRFSPAPPATSPFQHDRQGTPGGFSGDLSQPQILQRQPQPPSVQPAQPLQQRHTPQSHSQQRSIPQPVEVPRASGIATMHTRGPSFNGRPITNAQQMLQLSEQDRASFLEEEARRAKRNHKIQLLSKDNGLMTPQDKNFITRIQLQQLLTATGNLDEQGPEAALAEDFYYQIYSQIRGSQNSSGHQMTQFAQTYLHQTAGRTGNRRFVRGGDQIRRMEQQVQRAVEAAKLKPKNKQLVIEGSLGKISFSNAKTPKPLLNLKTSERRPDTGRTRVADTAAGRKATLRAIEAVYSALLRMEEHERRMPPQTTEDSSADEIQEQIDWRARVQALNSELWSELKVMEPIDNSSSHQHPFIAILSHPKGKKVLPRVFRQIDDQQRLTVLTMIAIHLDGLDVVRLANPPNDAPLPQAVRDEVDLFSQTVMHSLFQYINDAPLGIIVGLLGLILERVNVQFVARTKIGLALLTIFLSRAELIKEAGGAQGQDVEQYNSVYNGLFDVLEPALPTIFTTPLDSGEDVYVWQFLAAVGISANPEQQQRLVLGVKDRVMDTVTQAKQLSDEVGRPRLDNVNLFMKAIGLDVELLG